MEYINLTRVAYRLAHKMKSASRRGLETQVGQMTTTMTMHKSVGDQLKNEWYSKKYIQNNVN